MVWQPETAATMSASKTTTSHFFRKRNFIPNQLGKTWPFNASKTVRSRLGCFSSLHLPIRGRGRERGRLNHGLQARFGAFQAPVMSDGFEESLDGAVVHRFDHVGVGAQFVGAVNIFRPV